MGMAAAGRAAAAGGASFRASRETQVVAAAVVFALLSCISTCAQAAEWRPPYAPEIAAMAAAEILITVDIAQTAGAAECGWPDGFYERNPLLGRTPSVARVVATGVAAGLGAAALFVALPPRWRLAVPLLVGSIEGAAVLGNFAVGLSLHF